MLEETKGIMSLYLMTQGHTDFIQPFKLQVLIKSSPLDVMKEPYPDQVTDIELGKKADLFILSSQPLILIAKLAQWIS